MAEVARDHERVRLVFPDHLGLARGKYLPAHLASKGTGHCATLYGLGYDRSMVPAPGSYLLEGLIDVHCTPDATTARQSWEDQRTQLMVGDLSMHGEPFPYSARNVLKDAIAAWESLGYTPQIGIELEAYFLQPDGEGGWTRYENPRAMVYGTGITNDPHGILDDIMSAARTSALPIESINAEFDESQYELTLEYRDALTAADDAFLFKVMAREVAIAAGYDLTFLGKPFDELSGSGLHVNVSFLDAEGNNALVDGAGEDGLSALARHSIAGLCELHRPLVGLLAPTVNAYRRLQPGQLSGYWANWGLDHRCTSNRVPIARNAATRIESRVGDGAANIHLAVAAVLTAARLGLDMEMPLGPPETGDGFEDISTDVCAPANLSLALDELENATAFTQALGQPVVDNYVFVKRAEWERFIEAEGSFDGEGGVTDWERREYLPYH